MSFEIHHLIEHMNNKVFPYEKGNLNNIQFMRMVDQDSIQLRTQYIIDIRELLYSKNKIDPLFLGLQKTKAIILESKLFHNEREDLKDYERLLQLNKNQYDGLSLL